MRNRLTNAWSSHPFSSVDNLVDTTQVCEEKQQAAGRKGSKMDGPNAHSKEKEKMKKKGCLTKISNFITGSMEKGFYRSVKFFFYLNLPVSLHSVLLYFWQIGKLFYVQYNRR